MQINDKIHIVITDAKSAGGFFSAADLMLQDTINQIAKKDPSVATVKTNEAQIIYINYIYVNSNTTDVLSWLAHEFQHLLNFTHDVIALGKEMILWYSEMLSVLAQDLFHEKITPTASEPFHRLYYFNRFSNYGPTYWTPTPLMVDRKMQISYGVNYAFGAFLFRNYGGADLLRKMTTHDNKVVHIDAINYALKELFPNKGYTFDQLLAQMPFVLVNASVDGNATGKEDVYTLNREIKFTAGEGAEECELTAKKINLLTLPPLSGASQICFPQGKDEIDVIYPNGFLLSDIPGIPSVVYAKPNTSNIEISVF